MVTVDSKGRIVIPREVRERFGLSPGTEVEVREGNGELVVEVADSPEDVIDDLERGIERAASSRNRTPHEELEGAARAHVETIRNGASARRDDE